MRNSGIVSFVENIDTEGALSQFRKKLPQIERRNPDEINANQKIDTAIGNALLAWRGRWLAGLKFVLKTPANTEFTADELDLAGWIHEYAEQEKIKFSLAMEQIFDFLKRHPEALERYTKGNADFAESSDGVVSFSMPRGWSVAPHKMSELRRSRIYQAGNPGCDFAEAVTMVEFSEPQHETASEWRARIPNPTPAQIQQRIAANEKWIASHRNLKLKK